MSAAPAISVLMSVYNGERHVYPAVRSILDQRFGDFEFLIVNDGSSDDSGVILRELAAKDARIRLIDRENRGLIASLNEMIALARAPLLARMDADDIAMPRRFAAQVAFMAAHPEIGVLGTSTHDLDEDGNIIEVPTYFPDTMAAVLETLKYGPPLSHPSVMMRTDLVRQLGGYRNAFKHAEDYDLWLRCSRHTQIMSLRDRLILYRRTDEQISQKYHTQQTFAAAVAWHAHCRVLAGKTDPFDQLQVMPAEEELDAAFGEQDAQEHVMRIFVERMRYAPDLLSGDRFPAMLKQARRPEGFEGAARTVLRLLRMGKWTRALALGTALGAATLID